MFRDLWKRTKHVASTYTGTFVVVMLLNQLLFFGFCLNPICLVAAMPHVLLITVAIGSWINKTSNWGASKIGEETQTPPTTQGQAPKPSKNSIAKKIEDALVVANSGLTKINKKIDAVNVTLSAKSEFFPERYFVDSILAVSESSLALKKKLDDDPAFAKQYYKIKSEWDQKDGKDASVDARAPDTRKVANFILPTGFDDAGNGEEIKKAVARIATEHSEFLKDVKRKLDLDTDLMAIFEVEMEQEGGKEILAHIKAINLSGSISFTKPTGSGRALGGTASSTDKSQNERSPPSKRLRMEAKHKLGETPEEYLQAYDKKYPKFDKRVKIRTQAEDLGIPHLVHFTRCDNLPSILRHGLCSIVGCEAKDIQAIRNDSLRLDAQPDGISLSITFPNYRMFYKYRELNIAADWAVLILSPRILWEKKCGFYRHNAADSRMRNRPREMATSSEAFREMYETADTRREHWLRAHDPTDPQAEVMVYEQIEAELIETVAFETKVTTEKWTHVLGGIETIYAGRGKGLFASRAQVRQN